MSKKDIWNVCFWSYLISHKIKWPCGLKLSKLLIIGNSSSHTCMQRKLLQNTPASELKWMDICAICISKSIIQSQHKLRRKEGVVRYSRSWVIHARSMYWVDSTIGLIQPCFQASLVFTFHLCSQIQESGRLAKTGKAWEQISHKWCKVNVGEEGLIFKYVRTKLESKFLAGQDE